MSAIDNLSTAAGCLEGAWQALQRTRTDDDTELLGLLPAIDRADESVRDALAAVRLSINHTREVER